MYYRRYIVMYIWMNSIEIYTFPHLTKKIFSLPITGTQKFNYTIIYPLAKYERAAPIVIKLYALLKMTTSTEVSLL